MAFRFQRRIKIAPGVTINLSKGGVSTSVGVKGARVTLGRGKTRTTVGAPGTGLSYTDTAPASSGASTITWLIIIAAVVFWLLLGGDI